jgi:hypothetical protein
MLYLADFETAALFGDARYVKSIRRFSHRLIAHVKIVESMERCKGVMCD